MSAATRVILVTGFEPFGEHRANPSEQLAKAVDGRVLGDAVVRSVILPVDGRRACGVLEPALAELDPAAALLLGLAGQRARIALERVALNVMDYSIPDNAGYRATGEPCVAGGPAAYFTTLPLEAMLRALTAEGIPAYVSNTAGAYLCNQTLYSTLHLVTLQSLRTRVGFVHLPLLPSMVAESGLDEPSMDGTLMLRAVETVLDVIAGLDRHDLPGDRPR
jgi:pyroglutamyl-peptidase